MIKEKTPLETRKAEFSTDRVYRYTLDIVWDDKLALVQFIGLNPSTADEKQDDPTVRRCKGFARSWGAGGIVMTNLFALRATDPKVMFRHPQPIGELGKYAWDHGSEKNDWFLYDTFSRCKIRIACWGNHGTHLYRAQKVRPLLPELKCLSITGARQPQHPLYLKKDLKPIPMPCS